MGVIYFINNIILSIIFCTISVNHGYVQSPIRLLKATSQKWIAGVRGGGQSVQYNFKVLINTDDSIGFDSIWLPQEKFSVKVLRNNRIVSPAVLQKKDTAILQVSEYIAPGDRPAGTSVVPPVYFEGAALIRYYAGKEKKYLVCKAIVPLPDIHGQ